MKKYKATTAATLFLLAPCLIFLIIVKVSEKNTGDDFGTFVSSRSSISEIAQFIHPSSTCKCDCDTNTNTNNVVNNNNVVQETDVTTLKATTEDESDYVVANDVEQVGPKGVPESRPIIYLITPTYTRATQMADLTRFAQTLLLVKDIFWIVVEDAKELNLQVSALLNRTGIPSVHLLGPRPVTHMDRRSGRGVSNRLRALKWIRDNLTNSSREGVIYFADDDNTYDIRVFEEMRTTKVVSVFPVGLIAKLGLSSPILSPKTGKVVGFHDPFIEKRKFAVDMAGFAVNLQFFLSKPKATMPYKLGYEEDYFLKSLGITLNDLEPKASNCTEVLVWHTKTQNADSPAPSHLSKNKLLTESNLPNLYYNVLKSVSSREPNIKVPFL